MATATLPGKAAVFKNSDPLKLSGTRLNNSSFQVVNNDIEYFQQTLRDKVDYDQLVAPAKLYNRKARNFLTASLPSDLTFATTSVGEEESLGS